MILIIALILGVLWLMGLLVVHISTPLIHLLLLIAAVIFIYDLISRRGRV